MRLSTLVPASPARRVRGRALQLLDPISFWGGVSPTEGLLTDPRSRQVGKSVTDMVLFVNELRGSSSASSVLLELCYRRLAPCAIVLSRPDAILSLGALVAVEMNWPSPGIFRCGDELGSIIDNSWIAIDIDGEVSFEQPFA